MRKHPHRNQAQICAQRFVLPQPLRGLAAEIDVLLTYLVR